nr:uncharacterized protein LOC109157428 [Ipomoea trifida]
MAPIAEVWLRDTNEGRARIVREGEAAFYMGRRDMQEHFASLYLIYSREHLPSHAKEGSSGGDVFSCSGIRLDTGGTSMGGNIDPSSTGDITIYSSSGFMRSADSSAAP